MSRATGVDALRALALLAVVVVNVAGYRELPVGGPLPSLKSSDGHLADLLTLISATLLQGKGITLLTFLFGYSLVLGRQAWARGRLDRLLLLGTLHGFALFCGDILSTYALLGYLALRWRHRPLGALARRARAWVMGGSLWLLLLSFIPTDHMPAEELQRLTAAPSVVDWFMGNALGYGMNLLGIATGLLPLLYGLALTGLLAGRLRLLHHPRWHGALRSAARWMPVALAVSALQGWAMWTELRAAPTTAVAVIDPILLNPVVSALTHAALVPWLMLRSWPAWLAKAGRNTLSIYLGSSAAAVALWMLWGPPMGVAAGYLAALAIWAALTAWAASAERLPLEAWLSKRRPRR